MRIKQSSILTLLGSAALLALAGCAGSNDSAPMPLPSNLEIIKTKTQASIEPKGKYFVGQVQVLLANDDELPAVVSDMQIKNNVKLGLVDKVPNENIFLLEIQTPQSVDQVVKLLKQDRRVVAASRNRVIQLDDTDFAANTDGTNPAQKPDNIPLPKEKVPNLNSFRVNDALFSTQWSLNNHGQEAPYALAGKPGADIHMGDPAETPGSKDIVIGVIDTGIDYFHEDLAVTQMVNGKKVVIPEQSNIWVNPDYVQGGQNNSEGHGDAKWHIEYKDDVYGYNFVARNGDPRDDAGHGTHVSGTIGALRNNFKGISGIVGKVSLMALKFLGGDGGGSEFDAQLAIYYAIDMAKRFPNKHFILTNSWGASSRDTRNGDEDDMLLAAFAKASREGLLIVAAAGNDGSSNRFAPHYPANYSTKIPNMLTVAATNNMDQLADFSSYGNEVVQVAAPGVDIMSSVPDYIPEFGGAYASFSGTSMATPHVTGLAAAVWSANPNMTALDVKERIMNTVDILPQLYGKVSTSGRINVERALKNDQNAEIKVQKVVEEIPYVVSSPIGAEKGKHDLVTKVTQPGVKEISVCFSHVDVDPQFDTVEILSPDYRVRDNMLGSFTNQNWKGEKVELCSAPVKGDTLLIRFYNGGWSGGDKGYETEYLKVVK